MKIAIAGYGVEGQSSYCYFLDKGHTLTIVDERPHVDGLPAGVATILGAGAFERLGEFDMVIRTPSLSPKKLTSAKKIWSATNEFFAKCPAAIIGVTGSKGKGTTCSLIASMLRAAGQTVHLVGNIGVPSLDVLDSIQPEDIVVYELSSFQLWDAEKSPQVAVVLMIEPDHLDIHENFDDYLAAKANIRKYQTEKDICFYHPTNQFTRKIALSNPLPNAHPYNDSHDHTSVYIQDGNFVEDDCVICPTNAVQLPGVFNLENACAAISAVRAFGIERGAIEKGLGAFHGLDHRLKFIREVKGIKYYDDSIATTAGSAIAAMKAFTQPKIIILGGSSKGGEYTSIAQAAVAENVKLAILIGDEANHIEQAFDGSDIAIINLDSATTMCEVVELANANATQGDVVILSPACASFGMFKNYSDRGDQFIAAVNGLQ
jgi:UDP-N-acetylmuramoylalanine--D-glutamate ligase